MNAPLTAMPIATSNHSKLLRAARVPATLILGLVALSFVIAALERDLAHVVLREGGWVESATVACYGLACLGCLCMWWSGHWPEAWSGALLAVAAMGRELDVHKHFTIHSLSSIRYWRSDLVPLTEKGVLAGIMLVCAILVVRTAWPPLLRRLRAIEPHAVTLASIPLLFAVAQIQDTLHFDDTPGKLAQFFWAIEETFEMGIAACALVALLQWELHVRRTPAAAAR